MSLHRRKGRKILVNVHERPRRVGHCAKTGWQRGGVELEPVWLEAHRPHEKEVVPPLGLPHRVRRKHPGLTLVTVTRGMRVDLVVAHQAVGHVQEPEGADFARSGCLGLLGQHIEDGISGLADGA